MCQGEEGEEGMLRRGGRGGYVKERRERRVCQGEEGEEGVSGRGNEQGRRGCVRERE